MWVVFMYVPRANIAGVAVRIREVWFGLDQRVGSQMPNLDFNLEF